MILWMILTVMACAATAALTVPLVRRYEYGAAEPAAETAIYRDQLAEVDRDLGQGTLATADAELAKAEIRRRLLAAERHTPVARPISPVWRTVALAAVTGFVVLGGINLYALNGSPSTSSTAPSALPTVVAGEATAKTATSSVDQMIATLAARLAKEPGDADGWRMLGWSYFNTQRYDQSAEAYAKATALAPDNLDYRSAYAEALVQAAGGVVTPQASGLFGSVIKADPKEARARFYGALEREQAGELAAALAMWADLARDAPADAGWLADVNQHIADLGQRTGRDTSTLVQTAKSAPTGPSDASVGNQQQMIVGMVEGLAGKLAAQPHDEEGWIKLMRSRMVLGQPDLASQAFASAGKEFAGDPLAAARIAAAARELGVPAN